MPSEVVVRQPLRTRDRPRRTLDQRVFLLFPGLSVALFRSVVKRPPSSRLRQRALARAVEQSIAAYNRRDLKAVTISWHPEFEYRPERSWAEAALVEPSYRGREAYHHYVATVDEVWGGQNFLTPLELVDLGDRFVVLAEGRMRAQASGVELTEAYAAVTTLRDGRVSIVQEYYDHAKALEVVGLGAA